MNPEPIRIAWQSSKAVHKFPAYQRALEEHAGKVMSPGTSISMRGVKYEPSNLDYKCFDFLNNFQLFESVVSAEREGYDAVAVGCFFDPILEELREAVDIPVVSLAETSMHAACMLGRRGGHYAKPPRHQIDETYARFGLLKDAADPVADSAATAPRKRNAA